MKSWNILFLLILSFNINAEWKMDRTEKEISGYIFSADIKETFYIFCNKEQKIPIMLILTDDELSPKKRNVVSFSFDGSERDLVQADYNKSSIGISEFDFKDSKSLSIKDIINNLKNKNEVTIGFVLKNGTSKRVTFSLKGSSSVVSAVEKFCEI